MDGSSIASLVCLALVEVGMLILCIRTLARPPPAARVVYLELEEV